MSKRCPKLAKEYQGKPCFICESTETTVGAHLLSVGSHPHLAQDRRNLLELCYNHHMEQEKSLRLFVEKYNLALEMALRGFAQREVDGKWFLKVITSR